MNITERIGLLRRDAKENQAREQDSIGRAWYASRVLAFDQVLELIADEA